VNWRDLAYKTFWTAVSAVLGSLAVYLTELPPGWAILAIPIVNAIAAFIRQKTGETPPTLDGASAPASTGPVPS
jgi:hypothetical protein